MQPPADPGTIPDTDQAGALNQIDIDVGDVMRLCGEIAEEAAEYRLEAEPTLVMPVLIDEIEKWTPVLASVFAAMGAAVVRADQSADGVITGETGPPPELRSAITACLAELGKIDPESYAGLAISEAGPLTLIDGPTDFGAANRGQQAVRRVLSAMLSADLRNSDFAALVWDDSGLDEDSSKAIYTLARELPGLLGVTAKFTLLLFIGNGDLRTSDHCAALGGVRFRLTGRSLLQRRQSGRTTHQRIAELVRLSRDETPLVVLMLGAGAAMSAGLPSGDELRNIALEARLGYPVDSGNAMEAGVALYQALSDAKRLTPAERRAKPGTFAETLTLERVLREEQHEEHQPLSRTLRWFKKRHSAVMSELSTRFPPTQDAFRALLGRRRQFVIVTVNFDQVIEQRADGFVRPFIAETDMAQLKDYLATYRVEGGPVPVLKLHGDIDDAATIVANTDVTASGLSGARLAALRSVRNALEPVGLWWYVGYSMRDNDLNPILSSPEFSDALAERWVLPLPSPSVRQFIDTARAPRWKSEHVEYEFDERLVTLAAEDFWRALNQQWPVAEVSRRRPQRLASGGPIKKTQPRAKAPNRRRRPTG